MGNTLDNALDSIEQDAERHAGDSLDFDRLCTAKAIISHMRNEFSDRICPREHFKHAVASKNVSVVRCKRCGANGLHWRQVSGSYRLYGQDGLMHDCELTVNNVSRKRLYSLVDKLNAGELDELINYCKQLIDSKGD